MSDRRERERERRRRAHGLDSAQLLGEPKLLPSLAHRRRCTNCGFYYLSSESEELSTWPLCPVYLDWRGIGAMLCMLRARSPIRAPQWPGYRMTEPVSIGFVDAVAERGEDSIRIHTRWLGHVTPPDPRHVVRIDDIA